MCITPDLEEEAKSFETLKTALNGDRDLAYGILKSSGLDLSSPFPSISEKISQKVKIDREELDTLWRDVRASFDKERVDYKIIPDTSPLFPFSVKSEPVHYLYAAGNIELLSSYKIAFLGMGLPSLQGKEDTARAVEAAVESGAVVASPLDLGLPAFALSRALKLGGSAIAILSSFVSKCPNENLMELMSEIYKKGLLLTEFSPYQKREKWHVVYRNKGIAALADAAFLAEEKDGGPSWAIFDGILKRGMPAGISKNAIENPNYRWCKERAGEGAIEITKCSNIKKLLPRPKRVRKEEYIELTPDLFS